MIGKAQSVQELNRQLEDARQVRSALEQEWVLNLAFYQGRQWVSSGAVGSGSLVEPPPAEGEIRFTDNRIIGIVRTEIAKFLSTNPQFNCVPASADEAAIDNAELADKVLQYLWTEHDLEIKLADALLWARVCGAGFWKITWDRHAGKQTLVMAGPDGPYTDPQTGELVPYSEELAQEIERQGGVAKPQPVGLGDVCVEVRSPFEIIPDPLGKTLEECEWVVEEAVRSLSYLQLRYGDAAADIKPDAHVGAGIVERALGRYKTTSEMGVTVRELWARPGPGLPSGRHVVWAGGKVLLDEPNPYLDIPYVMFGAVPVPGRFWPRSIVSDLRGPQAELNKTRSQIRENAARIANPPLLLARQSVDQEYRGLPGEIIRYNAAQGDIARPSFMQPPEMPAYVQNELERMERTLQEISGQHEISKGVVPPGVTAASAINLLKEQDDSRFESELRRMFQSLALAGEKLLRLVQRYYTDRRIGMIAGESGGWDVFTFTGTQIANVHRVRVVSGAGAVTSKAARQAAMQDLLNMVLQYGVQVDQRDLRKFLRNFEVGGLEEMFASLTVDERQVADENRQLLAGQPLPINTYDDDQIHLDEHTRFQKTRTYRRAIARDPRIATVFEDHVAQHRQRLLQAQEQAAAAQMGQAPPPEQPGAEQPEEQQQQEQPPPEALQQLFQQLGGANIGG